MCNSQCKWLALLACLATVGAHAATPITPGLWEIAARLTPAQIAALPKDAQVPGLRGDSIVTSVCISAEMVDAGPDALQARDPSCTTPSRRTDGNVQVAGFTCNGSERTGSGSPTTTITDSRNFRSVYEFKGTVNGNNIVERHDVAARWVKADCGAMK